MSVASCGRDVVADDYVWARSNWGSLPMGVAAGTMSNGYGGYYVKRNAYGNNHESRKPFRNPNGFIVPAETGTCPAPVQQNVRVTPPQSVSTESVPLSAQISPATTTQTIPAGPYRLTRLATAPIK